jgi:hypothetical protein
VGVDPADLPAPQATGGMALVPIFKVMTPRGFPAKFVQ